MSQLIQPVEENPQFEIIEQEESTQDDELQSVLSSLGVETLDDIMLKVYRINDMGKEAHCFDTRPEAINGIEERLRKSYGRGDYNIKVFAPTPQGGKSIKKHIKMSIEVPNESEVITPVDNGDDIKSVVSSMMLAMQQNSKDMMQMFQTSQLESQNSMLKMMMESNNNKSEQPTMLELMKTVKAMMPEPPPQQDVMGMVNQMMEMHRNVKEEFSEPPKPDDTMGQLINGMTGLVDLAKNAPPQTQPAQPVSATQPPMKPPHLQNQSTGQPQGKQDMNVLIKMKIKSHLNFLIEKAQQNKNVDVYADLTIEEIPEQYYPQLLGALGETDEQGFINLMSINPAIEQHKEWFTNFCASIRSYFAELSDSEEGDLTDNNDSGDDSPTDTETGLDNADKPSTDIPSEQVKDDA